MVQARLLEVAIDQFGRLGFEGASTRDIASAAGTAMSSITYHFGGKQGLYLACADHLATLIRERQAPVFAALADPARLDRGQATELLLGIIDSLAAMMLDPASASWTRFIVREQQQPTEAFDRLWQGAMAPMIDQAGGVLERVMPGSDPQTRGMLAMLVFGQAMVLRAGRASLCRIAGVDELTEAEGASLRALILRNTRAILSADNLAAENGE